MPAKLTQRGRPLRIKAGSLGDDDLIAVSMQAEERVSRPFLFTVDCVSEKRTIDPGAVLNKAAALHIEVTDASRRVVHGIVRRLVLLGGDADLTRWRVEIVPKLWLLSLSSSSRIFEEEDLQEVLSEVLRDSRQALSFKLTGVPKRPYLVQYRENDLDFVHRLLEEVGAYYAFDHKAQAETVVVSAASGSSIPAGAIAELDERPVLGAARPFNDAVTSLSREYAMHSKGVKLGGAELLKAPEPQDVTSSRATAFGVRGDYVGDLGLDIRTTEARGRIEIEEGTYDVIRGTSTCAAFTPGTRVTVRPTDGERVELHLLAVRHRMEIGDLRGGTDLTAKYDNDFEAVPAGTPYRPPRVTPRPQVRGTHSAIVTGQGAAGEIDVDEHGRVLLEHAWNARKDKKKTKHRVHVASVWAGTEWGFVQHPRLGQRVLVEYLEGDPDRPIVTGRVYTHQTKPPYKLPGDKTQSGWKSRTLGGGADNFNELRFEDKKGSEHVYLQAEKDLQVKVKNDETRDVLHDRVTKIKNHDTRTVEEGDDTHTVTKGNQVVEVSQGDQTVTVKQGKQTVTVQADQTITIKQGKRAVTLDTGDDLLKVKLGNLTIEVDVGNITIKAKAGKIAVEAMQGIDMKCGQSTVSMTPAGIEMKSVQVKVEGMAQATVKAPMTTVEGSGQATVKGAMVQVQGQGMTQVKAPMTQVNGDGVLMAKGGVTMIN